MILPIYTYFLAAYGVLLGLGLAAAVVWDLLLATDSEQTISQWFLRASTHMQIVVVLIVASFGVTWGGVLSHLVWPKAGSDHVWLGLMCVLGASLVVGGLIGHYVFGQ